MEIFFGVDADGVVVGGFDVDGDSIFQKTELFEALGLFEGAGGQGGEALERCFAVCVETDVFPILGRGVIATVGDGGAGEVEGAAINGSDDFDSVGIGYVFWGTEDF